MRPWSRPMATTSRSHASGVLTTEPNGLGQEAEQGKNNVYVFDGATGETKFVSNCGVAGSGGGSKFTPNGRYLVFVSGGHCTPDDTDTADDMFRYDFQTGQIVRLSFGRNGNDGNGNDDRYDAFIHGGGGGFAGSALTENDARTVSADGSVVIFSTKAPLVSHDTNGATDVYMWEEDGHGTCEESDGCISLVSDGVDPHGTEYGIISASGRSIAFQTQRGLSPGDTDGVGDVYVAQVEGGFHTPHPPVHCGSPEACRSAPSGEVAAPVLGTEQFVGPGNSSEQLQCAKGRHRAKRHGQFRCVPNHHRKHHHKKRHHKRVHRRAGAQQGRFKS